MGYGNDPWGMRTIEEGRGKRKSLRSGWSPSGCGIIRICSGRKARAPMDPARKKILTITDRLAPRAVIVRIFFLAGSMGARAFLPEQMRIIPQPEGDHPLRRDLRFPLPSSIVLIPHGSFPYPMTRWKSFSVPVSYTHLT